MSQTILPEGWVPPKGYANGLVAQGKVLFIGGQIGWDPRNPTPTFPDTFAGQFDLALSNVVEVLKAAGGTPEDLTRMTIYVVDKREYLARGREIGKAFRELIGDYAIAMSAVQVAALMEDRAKVEIEVTAVRP